MEACSQTAPEESTSYRSPWRVLAAAFQKSRDRWKEKYKELQERIKAFRTEVRDLRRSRDGWRSKAEDLERRLNEFRAETHPQAEQSPPAPSQPTSHLVTPRSS